MSILETIKKDKDRFVSAFFMLLVLAMVGYVNTFFLTWSFLGILYLLAFKEALNLFKIYSNKLLFGAGIIWLFTYFFVNPFYLVFISLVIIASLIAYKSDFEKKVFLPFLYPTISFIFLLELYKLGSMKAILWLIVIVALTDIGAYFTGKSIGKTKFCKTSPNKTLEGVFGGVFLGTVIGSFFAPDVLGLLYALIISLICSIGSVFGDLFESYLKREANIKDSGDIIPGHGGILDRVDGYLFASVFMVVMLG